MHTCLTEVLFITYSVAMFSRIHRENRPKEKTWSRRGHWLYIWDGRRQSFHKSRSRKTGNERWRHALAKLRKQHSEKTWSYQAISSRHTVTTTCVVALFPDWKAKASNVLVQSSLCPLSGPATRWWPCPKSYLPLTRGQQYRPRLTSPEPAACSTAPWEPDAFMQVGWLSSINNILNGGTPFRDQDLLQTHFPLWPITMNGSGG